MVLVDFIWVQYMIDSSAEAGMAGGTAQTGGLKMAKNILIGQSGGPTAVINASLYGAIMEAIGTGNTIYGMINGIEGFLDGRVRKLNDYGDDIELLKMTPASFLGSCRFKLPEDLSDPVYAELFHRFEELEIAAFLYIGGNDSMDTVDKLSRYADRTCSPIRVIGVPKTIDNDLACTDHTPGFGSTAKYVASTVRDIVWDAGVYAHPVVTIIELMGRNAGWVTASSVLARTPFDRNPVLIYLPEIAFDMDTFIEDVKEAMKHQMSVVVCFSEGIKDKDGRFICEYGSESTVDQFGHKMMSGSGRILEQVVKERIGCKCRSIEMNLPQRCSATMTSKTDTEEAEMAGRIAIRSALAGETGKMVSFVRNAGEEYGIHYELTPVGEVCNREKTFPPEWIIDGHDISPAFREYVYPLIQGENRVEFKGGLPKLLRPAYLE